MRTKFQKTPQKPCKTGVFYTIIQKLNENYGYQFWLNTDGTHWLSLPKNMFALEGYNSNRCYIFPTEKIIVTRIGAGPSEWNEQNFITNIYRSCR